MSRILALVIVAMSAAVGQAQEVRVPKEVLQELDYLVGEWTMDGQVGAEKCTADYSILWSPGRHCLVYHCVWTSDEGKSAGTSIIGWDIATREIIDFCIDSWGGHGTLRYKVQSPTLWKGVASRVDEDGKPGKGQISLEKKGPKAFLWKETNRIVDGESQPDTELRFKRK